MIQLPQKQYQLVLWATEDRSPDALALRLDFDSLEQALAELERRRTMGEHRVGVLMQWHKNSGVWDLIEQFP